jgi:hypothetical protein
MKIFRVTSPEKAVQIIKSGNFIPDQLENLNADNGLNAFRSNGNYEYDQDFTDRGAIIGFEWLGDIQQLNADANPPLPRSVLLDQAPWRIHIRGPIPNTVLRVTYVCFKDERALESLVEYPRWISVLCLLNKKLHRKYKLKYLKRLREQYRNRECFVTIVQ